jgi:Golgi nucleoside diphosphatase
VDFIKEQVPEPEWDSTPVWLKATAGLRLLPAEEQDAIMASVRAFLATTPFLFRPTHARVISGTEVRPCQPL